MVHLSEGLLLIPTLATSSERLRVLHSYDVLDTPPEEEYERIVRLAAAHFAAPTATLTLIDSDRQWFKARTGVETCETPLSQSFCVYAVDASAPLVVEDTHLDARFADHPLVAGPPGLRFYAGAPLISPEGIPIGTLCVMDTAPRPFSDAQLAALQDFAGLAMRALNARRAALNYRTLFHEHPLPMWVLDPEAGRVLEVNEAALVKYGYSRPEFLALGPEALPSPGYGTAPEASGDGRPAPWRHFCRNGSLLHIEIETRAVLFGGRPAQLVQARDVSAEVTWRRAHQETEHRFRLLVDTVEEYAILLLDPTGRVVSWNRGARRLYGFEEDEVLGSHVSRFFRDGTAARPTVAAHLHEAATFGVHRTSTMHCRKDGSPFWAEIVLTPLRNEQGHSLGFAQITRDISLRVAHEQTLVEARDRAERTSRLKSRHLAHMGHEVRTPLTGIIGLAELLVESGTPAVAEFARSIRRNGQRLLDTLDTVLEYVRIEDDTTPLRAVPLGLPGVLHSVAARFQPRAAEEGLRFEVDIRPIEACAHEDALRRVLGHLLRNAFTFTPSGTITLRTRTEGGHALIEVVDTGVGMSASFLPLAYEPFQQEAFETEGHRGGAGLGLTIARLLVERMGGTLSATSARGEGSCFTIALPLP